VRGDDQQFDAHHADRFESHQRACLVTAGSTRDQRTVASARRRCRRPA
jgi:hypothetical protein